MSWRVPIWVMLVGLLLLRPPPIHAHAFLDHAEPRVGSSVDSPPSAVQLHFTEPIEPAFCRLEVMDAAGQRVDTPAPEHPAPDVLRVALLVLALLGEFILTTLRMREVAGIGAGAVLVELPATRWGRLWIVRALGLAVLAAALGARRPRWPLLAALGAVWLLARSFQGHAGAHGPLAAVIDWLHLLAGSAWLGSLVQLALGRDDPTARDALRVRALATGALALVVPAGIYAAFLHVPSLERLFDTPYGRALLAKLAVVVALLGLGALNHFRHVPALVDGRAEAAGKLRRTVRVEVVLGVAVLLLSALLGVLPMPHEFQP